MQLGRKIALLSIFVVAVASAGDRSGNGGVGFLTDLGWKFLDALEYKHEFRPEEQQAFEFVQYKIDQLRKKLPKTADLLESTLKSPSKLRWYFSKYSLVETGDEGKTKVNVTAFKKAQIAINSHNEVHVVEAIWKTLQVMDQAVLLVHEVMWTLVGSENLESAAPIRSLTGRVFSRFNDSISSADLGKELQSLLPSKGSVLDKALDLDLNKTIESGLREGFRDSVVPNYLQEFLEFCLNASEEQQKLIRYLHEGFFLFSEDEFPQKKPFEGELDTEFCSAAFRIGKNRKNWDLSNRQLTDVEALRFFPRIESLNLASNKIVRLKALAKIPALKELNLSYNRVTSLQALSELSLTSLNVSHNLLEKIDFQGLNALQSLNLSDNFLSDSLGTIQLLPELKVLRLERNQIESIESLNPGRLPQLEELVLGENPINSFGPIEHFASLRILNLKGVPQFKDWAALRRLPRLEELSLASVPLVFVDWNDVPAGISTIDFTSVTMFKGAFIAPKAGLFFALKHLNLDGNGLKDLSFLKKEAFPKLESLNLKSNYSMRLDTLPSLTALKLLNLELCGLQSVEGLPALPSLRILKLGYNSVKRVDYLAKMYPLLFELYLQHNDITDLTPFSKLVYLKVLSLTGKEVVRCASCGDDKRVYLRTLQARFTPLANLWNLELLELYAYNPDKDPASYAYIRLMTFEFEEGTFKGLLAPLAKPHKNSWGQVISMYIGLSD